MNTTSLAGNELPVLFENAGRVPCGPALSPFHVLAPFHLQEPLSTTHHAAREADMINRPDQK